MTVAGYETTMVANGRLQADDVVEQLLNLKPGPDVAGEAEVEALVDRTREIIAGLAADPVLGDRLALADCAAEVHIVGAAEPSSFTLLFDRRPVGFEYGPCPDAVVKLFMTPDTLAAFCAGQLHVPIAISDGLVGYEGPVRKLLRVLPLIRRYAEQGPHA